MSQHEDAPPNAPGARYFGENTPTLRPPPEKVAEINATLVKIEAERSAEVLRALQDALPHVATKSDLTEVLAELRAISGGVRLALGGIANLERDVADIKAAIAGEGGIIQKLDGLNQLGQSAYDLAASHHRQTVAAGENHASIAPEHATGGSGRPAG